MDADTTLETSFNTEGWTGSTDLGLCTAGMVNAVARGMAQIAGTHGVTHIEFALLKLFLEVEEWTATQLAHALSLTPPGISRSVSKLVDMGLIRRKRLRRDRRVVLLTLTKDGLALTQELCQRVRVYESALCEGISDEEMAVFAAISSKVMVNFAALGEGDTRFNRGPSKHIPLDE